MIIINYYITIIYFPKVAYVPPSMRNKVKPGATFKLSEDEPAQNAKVGQFEVLSILLKFEAHKRDMRYFYDLAYINSSLPFTKFILLYYTAL